MTDHEWVDWVIKKTNSGYYSWTSLENDTRFGEHYKGKTPIERDTNSSKERYKELKFIFIPRPNKDSNAELLVYEDRDRLQELTPRDRKNPKTVEFYEKRYNQSNYIQGLGFLIGSQKNSKTYKIERAILQQLTQGALL